MAHLATLLGGDRRASMALMELQSMTRDDSDIRLLAEMIHRAHEIIRSLGLNPQDATAEEIYRSLLAAAPQPNTVEQIESTGSWVLLESSGQVISFHPEDIIENYHHQLPLGRQRTTAGRRGLGHEIYRRYREHPSTHDRAVERAVCDGGICRIMAD